MTDKIEALAEQIVEGTCGSDADIVNRKGMIKYLSQSIRDHLAATAGVELLSIPKPGDKVRTGDVCKLFHDIDELSLALAARDAEIARLKQELESARRNGEA